MKVDVWGMLIIASAYFLYNREFWRYSSALLENGRRLVWIEAISFLINYGFFIAVSMAEFHLIVNWSVFFVLLVAEILIVLRKSLLTAWYLALSCVLPGLAINLMFRCGLALVLNKPLTVFNNDVSAAENIKQYPVFLGFLLTGLIFRFMSERKRCEKLKRMVRDRSCLLLMDSVLTVLYLFLSLNLLSYYTEGGMAFKLWGIKSAVFAIGGAAFSGVYSYRMSQLNFYRTENQRARKELEEQKRRDERMRMTAFTDPMTGCYNRYYADELLEQALRGDGQFCICFADLDGLKTVNDRYGHVAGDQYLISAAKLLREQIRDDQDYLFRYGGDEFLMLLVGVKKEEAERRAKQVQAQYGGGTDNRFPFPFSISFGIVERGEAEGAEELIRLADARMYANKKSHRQL